MIKQALKLALIYIIASNTISANAVQIIPPSNTEAGTLNKSNAQINENIDNQSGFKDLIYKTKKEKPSNAATGNSFKLNEIKYSGNTLYTNTEFRKFSDEYIGKQVSLSDLKVIIKKITSFYNDNGYITSFAYLPPQKIKNGVVEIAIVEGKIGKITIEGNKYSNTSYLKNNLLKSNGLKENGFFNVRNLRKSLGEINEKDYLKGQVVLQKGESSEDSDLTLTVKEKCPITFTPGWDNKGRDYIGTQRGVVGVGYNNLTGFGDRISATTILARRTLGVGTNYTLPLGPYGTEIQFGYGYSNVALGGDYKQYDISGHSHRFNTTLIQPIYKNDKITINSDLSLDMINSTTNIFESDIFQHYRERPLRLGLNAVKDDSTGRFISRFEASTGIPWLGATSDPTQNGVGSPKFFKLMQNITRLQSLPYKTVGIFTLTGQYSPNALLPAEQLEMGGANTVRGFKEACNYGDVGYYLNLELRRNIPYLPDMKYLKLKNRIQFATFYDQGFTHTIHQGKSDNYTNFLQGLGVGLRIFLTKYIVANLDLGIPLGKDRYQDQSNVRFHFSISSNIF